MTLFNSSDAPTEGNDLPSMSADDTKAFADMETAAVAERSGMKGGETMRIPPQNEEEPEPAATTPVVPAAPPVVPPADPAAVAAAPPPPAGAAPADDDDPEAVLANDGKRYVPLSTHINTRKGLQAENKDLKAALDLGNTRLNQLLEAHAKVTGQPSAAAPVVPVVPPTPEANPFDKTTHPLENLEWENAQLEKSLRAIEARLNTSDQQTAQQRAMGEARTAYSTMHNDFAAKNPEYAGVYRWAMDKWVAVNMAMGMTQPEAVKAAEQLEWQVVTQAAQRNQHPSAALMEVAKAAGWTPAAAATTPAVPGQAAAPGSAVTPPLTPAKQIELAQAGAAAAISLSDVAGGSPPSTPTLASLASMSKEEFDRVMSGSKGDALFRKLAMGGKSSAAA